MNNELTFHKTQTHAAFLVKEGMRIALAHSITGVSWRILREAWEACYGKDNTPPGRLPNDTIAYINGGQSPLALATVVSVYKSAEKEHKSPVEAFIAAWEVASLVADCTSAIDINAAWYAVRDVKSGLISWRHCKNCKAGYLLDTKHTKKTDFCPYCGMQEQKILVVAQ